MPRLCALCAVCACIALAVGSVRAIAWQAAPRLVPIHVAVTTSNGTPVSDLTKDDVDVSIDGTVQSIERFSAPPSPLSVVLLLDVTSSMTFYTDVRDEIGKSFGPALRPADRARVGAIAAHPVVAPRFSSRVSDVVSAGRAATAVKKEDRAGPSPIWDSVDDTLTALQDEPGVRGLILVTDGKGTGNRISAVSVLEHAVAEGVVVHVLSEARPMVIRQSGDLFARVRSTVILQELAKRTGGLIVPEEPPAIGALPPAGPILARFVNELRGMYTVAVVDGGPRGSYHRIAISVKRAGLMVRTRGMYRSR
jgi:VWFA-related protein